MDFESKQAFFAVCGQSCVSVYANEREGAVIALYGDRRRASTPQVAISVAQDCIPRLQVKTEAGLVILDLATIVKALACLGTQTLLPLSAMHPSAFVRQAGSPESVPSACTPSPLQKMPLQPAGSA